MTNEELSQLVDSLGVSGQATAWDDALLFECVHPIPPPSLLPVRSKVLTRTSLPGWMGALVESAPTSLSSTRRPSLSLPSPWPPRSRRPTISNSSSSASRPTSSRSPRSSKATMTCTTLPRRARRRTTRRTERTRSAHTTSEAVERPSPGERPNSSRSTHLHRPTTVRPTTVGLASTRELLSSNPPTARRPRQRGPRRTRFRLRTREGRRSRRGPRRAACAAVRGESDAARREFLLSQLLRLFHESATRGLTISPLCFAANLTASAAETPVASASGPRPRTPRRRERFPAARSSSTTASSSEPRSSTPRLGAARGASEDPERRTGRRAFLAFQLEPHCRFDLY